MPMYRILSYCSMSGGALLLIATATMALGHVLASAPVETLTIVR